MRKETMWFFRKVRHETSCTSIEDGWRLEILDLERRGIVLTV